ncbi:glycosyltransferase family 4 protein [Candidatus Pacearchaeota archaeon]|nr:glycosyltransferase family 4 protein [Candidatus Pacearchaeota archaeon]
MKIALIHTALAGPSGGEKQVLELAIQFGKLRHKVELFTNRSTQDCYPELQKQIKINVIASSIEKIRKQVKQNKGLISNIASLFGDWSNLIVMKKIGDEIAKKEFDIINCHNFPSEWAAYFAKKKLKVPVVWMCNEPPFWFFSEKNLFRKIINFPLYSILDRIRVKYIDKIIVLDYLNQKRVKDAYGRDSRVIRSGLDIRKFEPNKQKIKYIRNRYDIGNSKMLLVVGGFLDFKRPIDAINACKLLIDSKEDVKLVIVGIGPEKDKMEKLVEDLGIKDKVIFAGRVGEQELPPYYNACDILIFPAEQTWGLAVIEAMACKKPTISSHKSGVSEIIQNGKTGFVVDSRSPREIAEKVKLLMKDKKLYKKISNAAYNWVKNNISWQKYAENMEQVFKEVLKEKK